MISWPRTFWISPISWASNTPKDSEATLNARRKERWMAERRDDLPAEAITALWQGNKIEAIKILRQAHHLDLKDAKDKVDQYVRNEPALQQKMATAQTESLHGLARWLFMLSAQLRSLCITCSLPASDSKPS